jgi:hypothetical protein
LYDTPPQVSASWAGVFGGVYQGVFLGGSAAQLGIRGVFREVVCTEFGLRTYSPVGLCLHHRGMNDRGLTEPIL